MPPPPAALPLPGLLAQLTRDPGRPRLTWYGPAGERIELSGHVLDNWVTKTTNLLLEEYQVGPGSRVLVDLPVHWRTVVWAFAVWRAGACAALVGNPATDTIGSETTGPATTAPDTAGIDVVVTSRPEAYADVAGVEVVAVALPALARSFDGPLAGAVDAAAAVMTYGDVLTWVPEGDAEASAVEVDGEVVGHSGLIAWAGDRPGAVHAYDAARILLEPDHDVPVATVLAATLSIYAADGSLVLCDPQVTAELAGDPARRVRLMEGERISS